MAPALIMHTLQLLYVHQVAHLFFAGREYKNLWVKNNTIDYISDGWTPTFLPLLQQQGYSTLIAGKDHLTAASGPGQDGSIDAIELGMDAWRRSDDKLALFHNRSTAIPGLVSSAPHDQYGVFLMEKGMWDAQAKFHGSYASGLSCNSSQVCQTDTVCGFRCAVSNEHETDWGVDAWIELATEELLQSHWTTHGKEKPWFLYMAFQGPHAPLIASSEALAAASRKDYPEAIDAHFDIVRAGSSRSTGEVNVTQSRIGYAAVLETVDAKLARFWNFLEDNGVYNDTVIFLFADHGEMIGDHTQFDKGFPWEESLRVPLIIAGLADGLAQNRLEQAPVSTLSVTATILELTCIEPPSYMADLRNLSLLPLLQGRRDRPQQQVILSGLDLGLDFDGRLGSFESALKQYNDTTILKLVCCPTGCVGQGSMLPVLDEGTAQVALMSVQPGVGAARFEHNVLHDPWIARGVAEASELLTYLSADSQEACGPLLTT